MRQILNFPTSDDLDVVKRAVEVFLNSRNAAARNVMLGVCKVVLERYNVSKICFEKYIVVRSRKNGSAYIWPREFTQGRKCPGCGELIYPRESRVSILTILQGEYGDEVCYGCGACHLVFGKMEEAK